MLRAVCLPIAFLVLAPWTLGQDDFKMKDADRKKLGRALGEWVEAKMDGDFSGALDANEDLTKALGGVQKKLKGVPALACIADWEDILDSGRKFSSSGLRKGKSDNWKDVFGSTFHIWIPKKYNPKKSNWPILLYATDKPASSVEDLPASILDAFVVVVPDFSSVPVDQMMEEVGRKKMLGPVNQAGQELRVDRGRLFLLGDGTLAGPAARYASALPHLWAGCAIVGAVPDDVPPGNLALLPFESASDLDAAAAWVVAGKRRNAYPLEFEFQPTESWTRRGFWILAQLFDPPDASSGDGDAKDVGPARMKISVDKAANTIRIDANRIYKVDILLNDSIVDLGKPIHIIKNGKDYEYQATRGLGTLLEHFASGMDAAAVFTARIRSLDIPSDD